jgi:hypothetical protein
MAKLRLGVCGAVALLAAACLPISVVKAATITETYEFTASGFGSGSPVSTWSGMFTITYNPAPATLGPLALDAFLSNLPASYDPFVFSQLNLGTTSLLSIGDNCFNAGDCIVNPGLNQAWIAFAVDASGNVISTSQGARITTSTGGFFTSFNLSVTETPLPAGLPLFAGGLGVLGLLGWRKKRKPAAG